MPPENGPREGLQDEHLPETPHAWAKEERRMRGRTGLMWAIQYQEVKGLDRYYMPLRYVPAVDGWEDLEVPWCLAVRTPACFTYIGSKFLNSGINSPFWWTARSEWAAEVLVESVYNARRGWLTWIPPQVVADIEEMDIGAILVDSPSQVLQDAEAILQEIKRIKWSKVPSQQRTLPQMIDPCTPVYAGGDRVPFDPVAWKTNLGEDMYLGTDPYGYPSGRDSRGPRIRGDARDLPTEGHPEGCPQGINSQGERVRSSAKKRHGLSRREQGRADAALVTAIEEAGIRPQLEQLGMKGRPIMREVVSFLTTLVQDGRILPYHGEQFARELREKCDDGIRALKRRRAEEEAEKSRPKSRPRRWIPP